MKIVTQRCANNMSGWSSVQSTNTADSVEESTIPEKEVTEDAEVALEKKLSEGKKLELIADLYAHPCLWNTTSLTDKALEELGETYTLKAYVN